MAPGSRALAVASRWFDEQTIAQVFEPLVADWQREWQDAERLRRIGVWIRGAAALLIAIVASSPNVLLAASPAHVTRRVITRLAIWTTALTALNVFPFIRDLGRKVDLGISLYLLMLLLPQALALAFPFATTTLIDVIRTSAGPTRNERIATVKFAIAACALMFILVGWVFPAANQQYRVTMSRAAIGADRYPGPAPGLNELSIVDLLRDDALGSPDSGRAEAILRTIGMRLSLSVLPIVFIWMRWRALLLPRGHWYSPLPLFVSAPITFVACMFFLVLGRPLADLFYAPRWSAPSIGVMVLLIAALAIDRTRRYIATRT